MGLFHKTRYAGSTETSEDSHSAVPVDRTNLFTGRVEYHVDEDFDKPSSQFLGLGYGAPRSQVWLQLVALLLRPARCAFVCGRGDRRYDNENSMAIYTYSLKASPRMLHRGISSFELEFTINQEQSKRIRALGVLNDTYGPYDALNRLWPRYVSAQTAAVVWALRKASKVQ